MNKNVYWVIPLLLLLGVLMYFVLNPSQTMSVIDGGKEFHVEYNVSCTTDAECVSYLVGQGMPQDKISQVTSTCIKESGICDTRWTE